MRHPEEQPSIHSSEIIDGESIAIAISQPAQLSEWLRTHEGRKRLDSATSLPDPLNFLEVTYSRYADQEGSELTYDVEVEMSFAVTTSDSPHLGDWRRDIMRYIVESMEKPSPLYTVPHDTQAMYWVIDSLHAIRIDMTSSLHACSITLEVTPLEALKYYCDKLPGDEEQGKIDDPYHVLRKMLTLSSYAVDGVVAHYGDRPKHAHKHQLVIAPPAMPSPATQLELESGIPSHDKEPHTDHFGELGGLYDPKAQLQDIADFFNDPVGSRRYGLEPRHFLLYGPAGTGKTSLVEAFSKQIGATLHDIASSDIMATHVGESGLQLDEIFKTAFAEKGPVVLFFDEFDAIAGKSGATGSDTKSNTEVKNLLKRRTTEAAALHPNIVIAAATNRDADDIEAAIVRSGRLEPIAVPLPTQEERTDIWATILCAEIEAPSYVVQVKSDAHFTIYDNSINPIELAAATEGMTGADFRAILQKARRDAYRAYRQTGSDSQITQAQLLNAIRTFYQR